jgi:PAS domain S-box-containing protein
MRAGRLLLLSVLVICWLGSLALRATVGAAPPPAAAVPLQSASEIEYPPFCFLDRNGQLTGFAIELLQAAAKAMGREVAFRVGPWHEVKGWLAQGKVQVLPLVGRTPEREHLFDFTVPYMSLHGAIVIRRDNADIQTLGDLTGRRVAVMRGDNAEEFLRREDRGWEIHTFPTFVEALQEVAAGRCDAVVIQRLVALWLLQEHGFPELKVLDHPLQGFRQDFCFAVREGDRQTLALLNEGLALVIADGTHRRLQAKWFSSLELPSRRRLIVGGDNRYPPYEYLDDNGRPAGFSVELTRAIAQVMGLDIEIRLGPWHEMVQALEAGDIDVLQGMYYSAERDQKFDFTQPYIVNHYVSVVRADQGPAPTTVAELAGKVLVAQRGDFALSFLTQHGLKDCLILVEDQEEVLRAVVAGRADVGLVVRLGAMHFMAKHGWHNLVLGRTPLVVGEYCYASRDGQNILLAQFAEGLKVLAESGVYRRLQEKWFGVYRQEPFSLVDALRYSAMVLIPLLLILAGVIFWTWSLRHQVARRTAALQQSEARFRSLVEGAPDAIFVQTDRRFAYLNESACALFGAESPEQLLGRPVMERFHPRLREVFAQRIVQLNELKQRVPIMEQIYLRLDGSEVPVEVSAVPVTYEGKDGAMVFVRDITARKEAERELQKRQLMLARTEAIAHVGSWEWEIATDTVTWSEELFRIFQRDPARGAPPFSRHQELFPAEDMKQLTRAVAQAVKQGLPYELELRALRPDGTMRHCLGRGFPERGEDGTVVRLFGSLQDITEFKQAQERIAHLNNVLRAIRDLNQLMVRERDREALIHQGAKLLVDNRGYASVLIALLSEDRQIGSWTLAGHDADQKALAQIFNRRELPACFHQVYDQKGVAVIHDRESLCGVCPLASGCWEGASLVSRLQHEDTLFGFIAVALYSTSQVDPEEIDLFQEMAADLAFALHVLQVEATRRAIEQERQTLEERLFQAQKLEAVGRLAGGVAHDFNNMLGVILGHAEMALLKLTPAHPLYADLVEIMKAANRSADLTRQLLAFARRQTISLRVLDLNETVAGMLQMLQRLIGEDINLVWLPGAEVWPVKMDPAQIHQILANLCVNARDAMTAGGTITIETQGVSLPADYCRQHPHCQPGDYALLTVSDDGAGMDKETMATIFEPFFTTKEVGQGTGLGLATVYGIVTQNHGLIHVYSEPGQGTTFKIYLPRYHGDAETRPAPEPTAMPQGRGETILLAEDDAALRQITRKMLESLGYTVLVGANPEEAIQLAATSPTPINLLVSDVIMPQMNGKQLYQKIKKVHPHCRSVYISGYTANVIATRGILEDGVAFLAKPFTIQELAAKVRAALNGVEGQ